MLFADLNEENALVMDGSETVIYHFSRHGTYLWSDGRMVGVDRSNVYRGSAHQTEALMAAISTVQGIPRVGSSERTESCALVCYTRCFQTYRAASREEICGGAMHDALTVSGYPAIPTRFQAQAVTQSGKNTSKQKK